MDIKLTVAIEPQANEAKLKTTFSDIAAQSKVTSAKITENFRGAEIKINTADVKDNLATMLAAAEQESKSFSKGFKSAFDNILSAAKQIGSKVPENLRINADGKVIDDLGRFVKGFEVIDGKITKTGNLIDKVFRFNQTKQAFDTLTSSVDSLAKPFVALDTETAKLKTLGEEAAAMAPNLRDAAIAMSKDLPFAAAELQTTMFDALASGVKGGEAGLKSFADTSAKLAVGGASSIGDSTKLLAGQLNAYGKTAEDAGKFSDIFFNTVNYGVTSIPELTNTLSNVIPTAASLGIELENVGGALALMTSKGVPTAQSTTKLNALLLELAKPGAALKPILDKAGVSLASLKQDDLPVTLKKVSDALQETGKSALQVFSSSEAGAGFNVLAGDLDAFAETFENVRDTTGSSKFAYEQMADSVEVRTKQLKATVEAFLIQGVDKLGSGFVFVASSAQQLAPIVGTLGGLKAMIPDGLIKNTLDLGKNILSRVVPGLFAQSAATATATGAQTALNTAMLANPVGLVIGGIVALGAATKLLSDALHETAKEKLEDAKANTEVLASQREAASGKLNAAIAAQREAASYINLAQKHVEVNKQRSAGNLVVVDAEGAQTKLATSLVNLAAKFPGVVTGSKTVEENLSGLKAATTKNVDSIVSLGAELNKLDVSLNKARNAELSLQVDVAKEEVENELTDALDGGFGSAVKSIFGGGAIKKIASGDLASFGRDLSDLVSFGFNDEINEFFTGTSGARMAGENLVKNFSDKVYNATNAEDIAKAQADFVSKIALDGEQMGMSKEEQQKVIKSFNSFAQQRKNSLEEIAKNDAKLTQTQSDTIAKSFDGAIKAGGSAAVVVKKLSGAFQLSESAVLKSAMADQFKKATTSGKTTEEAVEAIAVMFGKSKKEATELLEEQRKNTEEAKKTAEGGKNLAQAFEDAKKAASGAVSTAISSIAQLATDIRKAKAEGDKAEVERLEKQRSDLLASGKKSVADQKQLVKDEQSAKNALGVEEKKKLDSLTEQIEKQQTELNLRRRTLAIGALTDEYEREVANAEKTKDARIKAIQDEVEKTQKIKNVSAKEKTLLLSVLQERLVFEQQSNEEINTLRGKYAVKRYTQEIKSFTEFQSAQIVSLQQLITDTESLEVRSNEEGLRRIEENNSRKRALVVLQGKKDIEEIISKNSAVVSAEQRLQNALASNNQEAVSAARLALEETRAEVIASDENIQASIQKTTQLSLQTEREGFAVLARFRIESNEDLAQRERDVAVNDAERAFAERLKAAKGNYGLELQAFQELQQSKRDAEEKFVVQSNALLSSLFAFQTTFVDVMRSQDDAAARKETDSKRAELKTQSDDLFKELKARKLSLTEYYQGIDELRKQQHEIDTAGLDVAKKFAEAVTKSFEAAANKAREVVVNVGRDYQNTVGASQDLRKDILELSDTGVDEAGRLTKVNEKYGKSFKTIGEATDDLTKREEKNNASVIESRTELVTQSTAQAILGVSQLAAAGELTLQSFTGVVLDSAAALLQAQIPVWVASIFGTEVSKLGVGGILTAAGLTATLYGLVGAAKSALGRKTGEARIGFAEGTIDNQPITRTSDNIPRLLSADEGIINAAANLARDEHGVANYRVIEFANKSKKPFSHYPAYKEQMRSTHTQLIKQAKRAMFIKESAVSNSDVVVNRQRPVYTYNSEIHNLYFEHKHAEATDTKRLEMLMYQVLEVLRSMSERGESRQAQSGAKRVVETIHSYKPSPYFVEEIKNKKIAEAQR